MKRQGKWKSLKSDEITRGQEKMEAGKFDLLFPKLSTENEKDISLRASLDNVSVKHDIGHATVTSPKHTKSRTTKTQKMSLTFGLTLGDRRVRKDQHKSLTDFEVIAKSRKQASVYVETKSDFKNNLHPKAATYTVRVCDESKTTQDGHKCDHLTRNMSKQSKADNIKGNDAKVYNVNQPVFPTTSFDCSTKAQSLLHVASDTPTELFARNASVQLKNESRRQSRISKRQKQHNFGTDLEFKSNTESFALDSVHYDEDTLNEDTLLELMIPNQDMFSSDKEQGNPKKETRLSHNTDERKQPFDYPKKQRERSDDMIDGRKTSGRSSKPSKHIFLKKLIGKESKIILTELTKSEDALKECIQRTKNDNKHLELFLEILAKAYECEMAPNAMIMLYETLKQNEFFNTLSLFLIDLQDRVENTENRTEGIKILQNILNIVVSQISINPLSATSFSRVYKVLKQIVEEINDDEDHLLDKNIQVKFTILTELKKSAEKRLKSTSSSEDKLQPPEDFRMIQVTPSANEIRCAAQPFLRPNKVNGEYDDLDHYLDVQFRLLREDFVGPLREGISQYIKSNLDMKQGKQKFKSDIRIYNATVYSPVITEYGFCYKLKLEMTPRLRRTNWSLSKRLIYGSLLCLTNDNFSTFSLGTVVGRDEKDITRGLFTIQLDSGIKTADLLNQQFKIAETSAYFESYKHVLRGLQNIKPCEMPFERYIVHCDSKVYKPAYISSETVFDLSPLVNQNQKIASIKRLPDLHITRNMQYTRQPINTKFKEAVKKAKAVQILDTHDWPDKESLHLDESQYNAIKAALTKEFSIIQGPPGTGKTYIGLKITKALLNNIHLWGESKLDKTRRPMLIVCYTNHALDQFLEGVCDFFNGDIVRVGGRSKSTILERCSLRAYRKCYSIRSKGEQRQLMAELEQNSENVALLAKSLDLYQNEIVHEKYLFHEMNRRFYNNLIQSNRRRRKKVKRNLSNILHWLGIEYLIHETKQQTIVRDDLKMFVNVDDELSERRNQSHTEGTDKKYGMPKSETLLIDKIRKDTVAFYIEDIIIPENTCMEQMDPKLLKELAFRRNLKERLQVMIMAPDVMNQEEANRIGDIWRMNYNDRWRLYRMWLRQLCNNIVSRIESKKMDFETSSERYRDFILEQEKEIMQNATVIGMTTSCAAKYQATLCEIKPKIVIVEEAAEVLEAHIVTSLSSGCEQLILIGDHKQLKPNPTVYKLAVQYKLNISLFERMVNNGIQFNTLKLQHRMRPEIADITRFIYPELIDHDIVNSYPNVKGISTNCFLIDHNYPEENNEDLRSYSNLHEALFIKSLCSYLLQQGYKRHQISVLTTYTGQLMCLRKQMPLNEFEGVRVTVVDNYQGEENDIVLLSLVRSNKESKIGFLKTDNRICVALSRAKIGFYLIGNFRQLSANSHLWNLIVNYMESKGQCGEQLKLYCQNHPNDNAIVAKEGKDFSKAPNGGCSKKCEARLECGHVCSKFCHVDDINHSQYKCTKPCQKTICEDHRCPDYCFEKCRPCQVLVNKVIPKCGHEQMVECSLEPEKFICQLLCEETLSCSHKCTQLCGEPHTKVCKEKVERNLRCGHTITTDCYKSINTIECPELCQTLLSCGHLCKGTCGKCNSGRLHMPCNEACKRILVCGHECSDVCNKCQPCKAKCENRCVHSICKNSCGELCFPCLEPCEWRCQHFKCTKLCSEPCDRPRCDEPCDYLLQCGHPCMGLCGEPCADFFCKECDFETVTEILFGNEDEPDARFVYLEDCGHNIESGAMDKYMDDKQYEEAIQLKVCPKCKTPIRKCLRYGSVIKENLQQIEMVKQANINKTSFDDLKTELTKEFEKSPFRKNNLPVRNLRMLGGGFGSYKENLSDDDITKFNCLEILISRVSNNSRMLWTEVQIATVRNQRAIFEALDDVILKIEDLKCDKLQRDKDFLEFYKMLKSNILKERTSLSEQEIDDFQREIQRGLDYRRMLKIKEANAYKSDTALEGTSKIENILIQHGRYTDDLKKCVRQEFEILKDLTKIDWLEISGEERLDIIKAMGLSKGHWFKCPNNHIYAIGECGGATQRGTCPECKEEIGGSNHRLTDGNSLAPEMDGATFAAYSEEANNMANFDLNDI